MEPPGVEAAPLDHLLDLARSRDPADRARLLDAVVTLRRDAEAKGAPPNPAVEVLLSGIFMSLALAAEHEIRRRLAESLADAPWAPPALINMLALDEIDIARPVIAASPLLADGDLIRVLVEATLEHQVEVARRPGISAPVVDAVIEHGEPAALTALAANETADVSPDAMRALVEQAKRVASLRSPLARHPRLTEDLAERLYVWVGDSLRTALEARFRIDPEALRAAVREASREAFTGRDGGKTSAPRDPEREAMERQLVEKLNAAGQLRPGYLLRALREDRLALFVYALAMLGRFDPEHIRRAIDSDQPELLALACAAIGMDRGVFPTILGLVRRLNGGQPGGGPEAQRRAGGAFGPFPADTAGRAFRQAVARV